MHLSELATALRTTGEYKIPGGMVLSVVESGRKIQLKTGAGEKLKSFSTGVPANVVAKAARKAAGGVEVISR